MALGVRRSDRAEMEMRGEYREVSPPERLISTESWITTFYILFSAYSALSAALRLIISQF